MQRITLQWLINFVRCEYGRVLTTGRHKQDFGSLRPGMSDEPAKIILGDTAISTMEGRGNRGFFRRKGRGRTEKTHCENCGAELQGHWCARCGQAAVDYHRSFRHVILDVLDSFLNWDSKFFATIAWLIVKPWRLTNDFVAGKRVRYVHPLRLYLLASILFFFAVNHWAKNIHAEPGKMSAKERAELAAEIGEKRADIESALDKKNVSTEKRREIDKALNELTGPTPTATNSALPTDLPAATPQQAPTKSSAKDDENFEPILHFDGDKPPSSLGKWLEQRARLKMGEHGSRMALFITTLFSNLPYMMLCCIPLFALVLKLLYVRRRIFYINHLVYALHIHTFAYVGMMLIIFATIGLGHLISGPLFGWTVAILWVAFAFQVLRSIRKVYRQNWFVSIVKFLFGGFVYLLVLSVALLVTFLITVALPET